jgi:hypothetical protein
VRPDFIGNVGGFTRVEEVLLVLAPTARQQVKKDSPPQFDKFTISSFINNLLLINSLKTMAWVLHFLDKLLMLSSKFGVS